MYFMLKSFIVSSIAPIELAIKVVLGGIFYGVDTAHLMLAGKPDGVRCCR